MHSPILEIPNMRPQVAHHQEKLSGWQGLQQLSIIRPRSGSCAKGSHIPGPSRILPGARQEGRVRWQHDENDHPHQLRRQIRQQPASEEQGCRDGLLLFDDVADDSLKGQNQGGVDRVGILAVHIDECGPNRVIMPARYTVH